MKIIHIISHLGGGGKERRLIQLIKSQQKQTNAKHQIIILNPIIDYPEIRTYAQVTVLNNSSRWELIKSLRKTIENTKPDIIHDWTGNPTIIFTLLYYKRSFKYKYVEGFIADGNPIKSLLLRIACKIAFKKADAIVSNSHAGLIAKHAITKKSYVIYNGFDFDRIKYINDQQISDIRRELDIPNQQYIISMIARLDFAKDWETFLKVAQQIQSIRTDIQFLAVGKGPRLNELTMLSNQMKLQNIKFVGFRSDVERIISASRITLLLTNNQVHAEGISNSIMESMAAGIPVIASEGGGTSEIISNGNDGYIIQPQDHFTASNHIINLLNDPNLYNRMSNAAKEKIKTKFLLKDMANKYINLYKSLTE